MEATYARWGGSAELKTVSSTYLDPPVVETSLLVHFVRPDAWSIDLFGSFRESVRERFPRFEEAPPIIVKPPSPLSFTIGYQVQVRGLYRDEPQTRVLQLQDDLFAVNWRKASADLPYPRYGSLRHEFVKEFDHFVGFLSERGIAAPQIRACQVTYINIVDPKSGLSFTDLWGGMKDPGKDTASMSIALESVNIGAVFRKGSTQLTYNLSPVLRLEDNSTVIQLVLTSISENVDPVGTDLLTKMDQAHELLVDVFEASATYKAKTVWGKEQ